MHRTVLTPTVGVTYQPGNRRRLALSGWTERPLQRRAGRLCHGRAHDKEPGHAGPCSGRGGPPSGCRADMSLRPWGSILCDAYRRLLKQFGMTASMSRKGNCYDNAAIESFWGTLKTNSSITAATSPGSKLKTRLQSTSKCSTTGSEPKHVLDMFHPPSLHSNTI